MMDLLAAILTHPVAMLVYGMAANLLGLLAQASADAGHPVNPLEYVRSRPYQTALGVIASMAGYVALASTGQLNPITAFGVGYMGPDALSKLADAASNRFRKV